MGAQPGLLRWLVAASLGASLLVRQVKAIEPVAIGLLGAICFHLCLHSFYGDDPLLYSAHSTFAVIALVALGLRPALSSPQWSRFATPGLWGLAVVQALNNGRLFVELLQLH